MKNTIYDSLNVTAKVLGLPPYYLRELAEQQKIPALKIKKRWRFDTEAVREALKTQTQEGGPSDDHQ